MAGERTEAPTPKRREDARKQGNVSRSQEVVSMGVLLAAVIGLRVIGPQLWSNLQDTLREGLSHPTNQEFTPDSAFAFGQSAGLNALTILAPLFAIIVLAAIALNVGQTGLLLSGAGLKPKMSRVNPGAGIKRIISADGLVNLGKALAKMTIIALVVYMSLKSRMAEISSMGSLGVAQATVSLGTLAFDIAIRAAVVLFGLAIADYAWQRRQWMSKLRMSKEDVKQEMKESDGDPQVKQAIRRKRQQLMNRMIAAVPTADVVVTNPTHFAVALKYDPVTMGAPIVVAKGADLLAKRIREVARKANVPVLEEPPLARALYAACPIGQHIPANLFHAVAEVLAWVYALRAKAPLSRRPAPAAQGAR
jgi:flagellar biosynthetic protein FlhB